MNKQQGHLLRTKPSGTDEGGVATGYSVLDSPFLVDTWPPAILRDTSDAKIPVRMTSGNSDIPPFVGTGLGRPIPSNENSLNPPSLSIRGASKKSAVLLGQGGSNIVLSHGESMGLVGSEGASKQNNLQSQGGSQHSRRVFESSGSQPQPTAGSEAESVASSPRIVQSQGGSKQSITSSRGGSKTSKISRRGSKHQTGTSHGSSKTSQNTSKQPVESSEGSKPSRTPSPGSSTEHLATSHNDSEPTSKNRSSSKMKPSATPKKSETKSTEKSVIQSPTADDDTSRVGD